MAAKEGKPVIVTNKTQGYDFATTLSISDRQCGMLLAGGLLNFTREQHA
jgi:aconitate hydratase